MDPKRWYLEFPFKLNLLLNKSFVHFFCFKFDSRDFFNRLSFCTHDWNQKFMHLRSSATLKCYLLSFLSHSLGALMKSQFPVFTIYAQKVCLKQQPCERAWSVERVQGYAFSLQNHIKRKATAKTRQDCYELCFGETDFLCRWVFCVVAND